MEYLDLESISRLDIALGVWYLREIFYSALRTTKSGFYVSPAYYHDPKKYNSFMPWAASRGIRVRNLSISDEVQDGMGVCHYFKQLGAHVPEAVLDISISISDGNNGTPLLDNIPMLQRCRHLRKAYINVSSMVIMMFLIELIRGVRELSLIGLTTMSTNTFRDIIDKLYHLESLYFSFCGRLGKRSFSGTKVWHKLKHIEVNEESNEGTEYDKLVACRLCDQNLIDIADSTPNLESLVLKYCEGVTPETLIYVSTKCVKLKSLCLLCSEKSREGWAMALGEFVKNCTELRHIQTSWGGVELR